MQGQASDGRSGAPKVTFYTKAGCHLCENARQLLDEIAVLMPYELTEIDIRTVPEIYERYRYRIPVIVIDDSTVVEGRITYHDLAEAFRV
jgi:glutaredoxin